MAFHINKSNTVPVIEIEGKFLGSQQGPEFKEKLNALKEAGDIFVVVDLSKTDLIDSSGIGVLISVLTTMRRAEGDVLLSGLQDRVKAIFRMSRLLGPVFEDFENAEGAIASFEARKQAA